ncbi:hypothetical protein ABC970_20205 [Bacillus licheniformis]|nr:MULTISPECIES: hypothetical protein [Bacillus]MCD2526345.1 hypothetical protein [Bacillus licheniformis]MDE1397181.1 hypothetical protein [Bacillus licheniformis]PAC97006.1 hypothetical protein CHH89_19950 [Bacillus licheniformis]PAE47498.1 hypothetical protein CHH94_09295 [Bacillus licheniformis]TWN77124.1 hypothetical protein CHCC20494_1187 [Bacillus licheniformis]
MRETKTTKETMKPITLLEADIIFKALYYVASNEGLEITEELTDIYKVLVEDRDSDVSETLDVMENISDFIKNSDKFEEYFLEELEDQF